MAHSHFKCNLQFSRDPVKICCGISSDGNLVFCNEDPSAMEPTEPDL